MRIKNLIFVLLIYASSLLYAQQEIIKLSLDEAVKIGLENNRDVKIAEMEVKKAHAAVKEAFGYALPSLDFSAGFTRFIKKPKMPFPDFNAMLNNATYGILFNENVIPYDPSKFLPMDVKLQSFALSNNYKAEFQVSQIIFNSAVFRGIGASEIYLNLAKVKLKQKVSSTSVEIKKAFYGILLTERLYKITKERYDNALEHLENIEEMRRNGLVPEFTEMSVKVKIENLKPILKQLENANTNAKNGLKILLNLPIETNIELTGKLELDNENLPPLDDLLIEAKQNNLTLKTLKIKNKLDKEFTAIDKGGYWPTIVAFGNYDFQGSSDEWDFRNYQSSTVGLSFSINLFQGLRTKHKIEQDVIVEKQTIEQIKTLSDATEMQIISKYNDLLRVKKEISAMKQNIVLAEEAYKIAENRFKQGLGSRLEVNDADISLSDARVNYAKAVHDFLVAKSELLDLVGRVDNSYYEFIKEYLK